MKDTVPLPQPHLSAHSGPKPGMTKSFRRDFTVTDPQDRWEAVVAWVEDTKVREIGRRRILEERISLLSPADSPVQTYELRVRVDG